MNTKLLKAALIMVTLSASAEFVRADSKGAISLAEATAKAVRNHPSLAAFDAEIRMAEAEKISALERPNPELEVEAEDVFGSGIYQGTESAIYNVGISQLIELGKKRRLRSEIAHTEVAIEQARFEVARREVIQETASRFVGVLAAQAEEENAAQNLRIDSETVETVKSLKEGGRGSDIDVGRSALRLKQTKLELENRKRETEFALRRLVSMWGEETSDITGVIGTLTKPRGQTPELDRLEGSLGNHPLVGLASAGVSMAEGDLQLQREMVKPDVTVGVGYRRDTIVEDDAVVLSLSLPLPFWNRNEGGIAKAEARIDRQESLVAQARTNLEIELGDAHMRLIGAEAEFDLIENELIPAAVKQYESIAEGFRLGRISFLELLEARRSMTGVRKERTDALAKYHTARVQIETLTGNSL